MAELGSLGSSQILASPSLVSLRYEAPLVSINTLGSDFRHPIIHLSLLPPTCCSIIPTIDVGFSHRMWIMPAATLHANHSAPLELMVNCRRENGPAMEKDHNKMAWGQSAVNGPIMATPPHYFLFIICDHTLLVHFRLRPCHTLQHDNVGASS